MLHFSPRERVLLFFLDQIIIPLRSGYSQGISLIFMGPPVGVSAHQCKCLVHSAALYLLGLHSEHPFSLDLQYDKPDLSSE